MEFTLKEEIIDKLNQVSHDTTFAYFIHYHK